jgi:2-C-methyl-D-erythritol 2,4-cyclodiphosphate synthase
MRIGHGYDLHALAPGRRLRLGGVEIPHSHGPIAHSDGDVLLHALADALLGAAALGDIGQHFPDTDPAYAGADSRVLLRRVVALLRAAGYAVINVDATVLAQRPKLAPHRDAMRGNIAADLGLDIDAVSVKATTTEGLGPVGRGEAIAAHAVCLLARAAPETTRRDSV